MDQPKNALDMLTRFTRNQHYGGDSDEGDGSGDEGDEDGGEDVASIAWGRKAALGGDAIIRVA